MPQTEVLVVGRREGSKEPRAPLVGKPRRFAMVHAPQPVVPLDLRVEAARWLAHPGSGELPVVAGVERGGVEHEDRDLGRPAPVVVLGLEVRIARGVYEELVEMTGLVPVPVGDLR